MRTIVWASVLVLLWHSQATLAGPPLSSWKEGPTRKAILRFVTRVTTKGSPDYIPVPGRIAVFDNDGTLWCEKPIYVELAFTLDRVKQLSSKHPDWKEKQPFRAVLENDRKTLATLELKQYLQLILATHSGTSEEFHQVVSKWIAKARHPRFKKPYTACVYQPMLELLTYLRANGFKTYIVSGGGVAFMRPWTEKVYGIPPEQVIGSSMKLRYEERGGKPVLVRLPQLEFIDDKTGKPVGIRKGIGRRPVMAFGNSDGDYEMLRYVTAGKGPRFGLIVHHTDARREYAYDRKSHIGRLDRALNEASKRGWVIADMKKDWKRVFPWEK